MRGFPAGRSRRKQFFFEKKNQKTFICFGRHRVHTCEPAAACNEQEFLVLFFKKELLPRLD
jgi:hypothetical protein